MPEVFLLLACYGLTFLVCDATIFERPRNYLCARSRFLVEMLSCYFCTGFWTSATLYLALFPFDPEGAGLWRASVWLAAHALAGAAFSYALNVVLLRLEAPRDGVTRA